GVVGLVAAGVVEVAVAVHVALAVGLRIAVLVVVHRIADLDVAGEAPRILVVAVLTEGGAALVDALVVEMSVTVVVGRHRAALARDLRADVLGASDGIVADDRLAGLALPLHAGLGAVAVERVVAVGV